MTNADQLAAVIQSGNWDAAEKLLRRVAKAPGAPASVAYNLAKVLLQKDNRRQAIHWFRTAIAKNPRHAAAWFELGRCRIDEADYVQAFECFSTVVKLDPDDVDAWRNLGRVAGRLGEWDTACQAWARFPDEDHEAACALFRARAELGQTDADSARALVARIRGPEALAAISRTGRGVLPLTL